MKSLEQIKENKKRGLSPFFISVLPLPASCFFVFFPELPRPFVVVKVFTVFSVLKEHLLNVISYFDDDLIVVPAFAVVKDIPSCIVNRLVALLVHG